MSSRLDTESTSPASPSADEREEDRKRRMRALRALDGEAFPNLSPVTRESLIQRLKDELSRLDGAAPGADSHAFG